MFLMKQPVPTHVKEICFSTLSFDPMPEISLLCFRPPSEAAAGGVYETLLPSPAFILMYKASWKMAVLRSLFPSPETLLSGNQSFVGLKYSYQFSLGLDISCFQNSVSQIKL